MDSRVRDAVRRWEASRNDLDLLDQAVSAHRRAGLQVPTELLGSLPRWTRLAGFMRKWFEKPLTGVSSDQLDEAEERIGPPLPAAIREFYELAGSSDHVFETRLRGVFPGILCRRLTLRGGYLQLLAGPRGGPRSRGLEIRETDLGEDDPHTYMRVEYGFEGTGLRASELFLVAMLLSRGAGRGRTLIGAPRVWGSKQNEEYPELPLPVFHLGNGRTIVLHGNADTVVSRSLNSILGVELAMAAARTDEALKRARRILFPRRGFVGQPRS